jgi:Bacterial regulatory helix-turn-helix protein, lysR family
MVDTRLSIRLDLTSGNRIGPGKIALLEAIQATGSISAAARRLGMSYRRAWLLVEQINDALQQPAVTAAIGGRQGGGAVALHGRVPSRPQRSRLRRRAKRIDRISLGRLSRIGLSRGLLIPAVANRDA